MMSICSMLLPCPPKSWLIKSHFSWVQQNRLIFGWDPNLIHEIQNKRGTRFRKCTVFHHQLSSDFVLCMGNPLGIPISDILTSERLKSDWLPPDLVYWRPYRRAGSYPPPSNWAWVISPGSRASVGDDFHQSSTKVQYLCYNCVSVCLPVGKKSVWLDSYTSCLSYRVWC